MLKRDEAKKQVSGSFELFYALPSLPAEEQQFSIGGAVVWRFVGVSYVDGHPCRIRAECCGESCSFTVGEFIDARAASVPLQSDALSYEEPAGMNVKSIDLFYRLPLLPLGEQFFYSPGGKRWRVESWTHQMGVLFSIAATCLNLMPLKAESFTVEQFIALGAMPVEPEVEKSPLQDKLNCVTEQRDRCLDHMQHLLDSGLDRGVDYIRGYLGSVVDAKEKLVREESND